MDSTTADEQRAGQYLDELIARLSAPLGDEMLRDGWTEGVRSAALEWFIELRSKLQRGEQITKSDIGSGIPRWLDVGGVYKGELLDLAAEASEALRKTIYRRERRSRESS